MKISKNSAIQWLYLSVVIVLLDQLSKHWVMHYLGDNQLKLFPFLNFRAAFNKGAAFSFLGGAGGWQIVFFAVLAAAVSIMLIYWLIRTPKSDCWQAMALSAILGGAIGNLIDRVRFGFVVDFIDFHVKNWHFATFNIADIGITVGAAVLILRLFLTRGRVQ